MKYGIGLVLALALGSCPVASEPVQLGATTHFSQGWPIRLMDNAKTLGVATIRDSLHWAVVEKVQGQYDFSPARTRHLREACASGMTVLLGIDPRNRIYDAGMTAHSPLARQAFANYIKEIADRFSGCVVAIEIGNEINGRNGMTGPAAKNRAQSHTALVKAVHDRVKPVHPGLKLIGGSTNVIGTGFLKDMFAAGLLDYVDGIAVHPYRNDPEGVDWEINRLRAAMTRAGKVKPIWITEFSRDFAKPEDAPDFFLKMLTLAHGAGVDHQYWYALIDQSFFPTMGLLTTPGAEKPASRAFAYAAKTLIPAGPMVRLNADDPNLYHFRFGPTTHVVWGGRRSLKVGPSARFRTAEGAPILSRAEVSTSPVIIEGVADVSFGPAAILADSFYDFGQAGFSYFAKRPNGATLPLAPIDWRWTSYVGSPLSRTLAITPVGLAPVGRGPAAWEVHVRHKATQTGPFILSACLKPMEARGDGVTANLLHNGRSVWSGGASHLTGSVNAQLRLNISAGDTLDLAVAPNKDPLGDRMQYRLRVSRTATDAAEC